jgi:hypothetical protein
VAATRHCFGESVVLVEIGSARTATRRKSRPNNEGDEHCHVFEHGPGSAGQIEESGPHSGK